ncbi:MAG: DUF4411 family protein [Magnetococcales bacterium]|nr:DUF4411 family protein [Magnetococcales bacterium]MBF0151391.1 DUF4411 family protein [Magnetococcales bacterium]MBF0174357.1 DUF4411 family protein [Magnetococcales bacterium]
MRKKFDYLLDSNVFIEAKNRYYAFDICPGFWEWMNDSGSKKHIKIPNICKELNVSYINTFDMLRKGDIFFNYSP